MMSLQTVPLYGKHWPPVVDILVQDRQDKPRQARENVVCVGFVELLGLGNKMFEEKIIPQIRS